MRWHQSMSTMGRLAIPASRPMVHNHLLLPLTMLFDTRSHILASPAITVRATPPATGEIHPGGQPAAGETEEASGSIDKHEIIRQIIVYAPDEPSGKRTQKDGVTHRHAALCGK